MPLLPALLDRLQKRGIIKQEEEVIAENYDKEPEKKQYEENAAGAPGCPNKYNQYHVCVEFCYDHWGDGTPELPEKYVAHKNRMLARFPLPENWVEVYDKGLGRYYFWNKITRKSSPKITKKSQKRSNSNEKQQVDRYRVGDEGEKVSFEQQQIIRNHKVF